MTDLISLMEEGQWRLVLPGHALAPKVTNAERRWQRTLGGTVYRDSWDEAWLFRYAELRIPSSRGFATFFREGDGWALYRVWLEPEMRRRGYVSAAWSAWRERYGDFGVIRPNEEMRQFLSDAKVTQTA